MSIIRRNPPDAIEVLSHGQERVFSLSNWQTQPQLSVSNSMKLTTIVAFVSKGKEKIFPDKSKSEHQFIAKANLFFTLNSKFAQMSF